jgi:hypothetical protein
MSTRLSLREALARWGQTPADPRESPGSQAIRMVLVAKEIARPVELARVLVRRGVSLRKAHDILNRISQGACVPVELAGDSAKAVTTELSDLGVSAHVIRR